jgi:hypothetical protein
VIIARNTAKESRIKMQFRDVQFRAFGKTPRKIDLCDVVH